MGYYRIRSHLRLTPSSRPSPALHVDAANSSLRLDLRHACGGPPRNHGDQLLFHFDSIIQNTSQEATFDDCASRVVEDVLCGYNGTVMAYGQSGSGKTFTMCGDLKNAARRGIIPRAIQRIFSEKLSRPEAEISIHVSYIEIYNDVIYDLLTERRDSSRIVTVMEENCVLEMKGLSQFHCNTQEDAFKHHSRGERHRSVGPNTMHKMSNRSHCIFTIYVERHTKMREFPEQTAARLNLVDLAGCERFKGMDVPHQSEKEILSINKSLTFLEQVVSELRKGQGHISFRQSRLTMLLKDALGGNSKTVLIVCALQEHGFLDETISSLRFAQRVKDLKTSAVVNKVMDSIHAESCRYERKIAELKRELALHDALHGRVGISHDDVTEQKRVELRGKVEAFLSEKAEVDIIPVESLAQIKETFYLFKEAQISLRSKIEKIEKDATNLEKQENRPSSVSDNEDGVGELEHQGFHVGIAPLESRPVKMYMAPTDSDNGIMETANITLLQPLVDEKNLFEEVQARKHLAFAEFKHTNPEGMQHHQFLNGRKSELKEKKLSVKRLFQRMKECKQEIHEINCLLKTDNPDELRFSNKKEWDSKEEFEEKKLRERLEVAKTDYQKYLLELKQIKSEIQMIRKEMMECQKNLLESFFIWYESITAV